MKIEFSDLLNIEEVMKKETDLPTKKVGKNLQMTCPFHGGSDSLRIDINNNRYNCFACKAGGDWLQFLMDYRGFSFLETLAYAQENYGVEVELDSLKSSLKRKSEIKRKAQKLNYRLKKIIKAGTRGEKIRLKKLLEKYNLFENKKFITDYSVGYYDGMLSFFDGQEITLADEGGNYRIVGDKTDYIFNLNRVKKNSSINRLQILLVYDNFSDYILSKKLFEGYNDVTQSLIIGDNYKVHQKQISLSNSSAIFYISNNREKQIRFAEHFEVADIKTGKFLPVKIFNFDLDNYYRQKKTENKLAGLTQEIFKKMKKEGRNYSFYLNDREKIESYQKLKQGDIVKGLKLALF
ncbi:CHC2 zinc finger domain-containing protein [Halanaerobium congolense]|uniref:CHC2 zinc finger n=3 Tax=Halanaerobium congolense TaxID=54121 RepID=A0A1I0CEL2_9FIRM|nr:CHC2 zinc finger domain-containing protein [Halanaerobium congolense]PTX14802.1 CHC2-type zinc finger protein [Halanaerobium congolense]SET17891.1 CHC2 zinc finger [Halanaerobium congolense]SFP67879.1 CHC2 zinc finger [Halanaerobium congolense]